PHLTKNAVCGFHDSNLITAGLENIQTFLRYCGRANWFGVFKDSSLSAVFLDTLGDAVSIDFRSNTLEWANFKNKSRDSLLLEIVERRCSFNVSLRPPPLVGF